MSYLFTILYATYIPIPTATTIARFFRLNNLYGSCALPVLSSADSVYGIKLMRKMHINFEDNESDMKKDILVTNAGILGKDASKNTDVNSIENRNCDSDSQDQSKDEEIKIDKAKVPQPLVSIS